MRRYHPSSKNRPLIHREDNSTEKGTSSTKDEVEEDYMSMDFILKAQSFDATNCKPKSRRKQSKKRKSRDHDHHGRPLKKAKMKVGVKMEERRNEGMATPIPSSNKGFKLLSKMGYKRGDTIGKQRDTQSQHSGRRDIDGNPNGNDQIVLKEPIAIKIRASKSGLGVQERKEQRAKALSERMQSQKANRDKIFKLSIRERTKRNQCIRDIKSSRIICQNMDVKADDNLENPLWFGPIEEEKKWNEEEPEIPFNEFEYTVLSECERILSELVEYLRTRYRYCYWCGILYQTEEELLASCPGKIKDLHDSLTDF